MKKSCIQARLKRGFALATLAVFLFCNSSISSATPPKSSGGKPSGGSSYGNKPTTGKTWPKSPPKTHTSPPKTQTSPPHVHTPPPTKTKPPGHTHTNPPGHINIIPPNIYSPPPTYVTPPTYVIPNQPPVVTPPTVTRIPVNQLPPTTQAVLKPNTVPDRPAEQVLKANDQLLARAISYDELVAAFLAVQAEQQQKLDEIKDGLGPEMLADPGVDAALDNLQDKINNGEEITDADIAAVNDAVINALNNGVPITGGATEASVNQALGNLQTLSQIQQVLQFWPPDGTVIPVPTGIIDIIYDPFLPADTVYVLPGGAVLDGTGGMGGFEVGQGTFAEAAGLPSGVGAPVSNSTDPANCVNSGLLVMNPAVNSVGMEYVVNNQNYSTPAGYNQMFPGAGSWLAQFNRGGSFGDATYSLNDGTYYFAVTDRGWELYVRTFTVDIDNTKNKQSFDYVVGNTNSSVAAGKIQTHTSKYPICIRFDRGGGNNPIQKLVGDPTVGKTQLRVAINPDDNLWDLYPEKNFSAAATAAPQPTQPVQEPTGPTVKFSAPPPSSASPGKLKFPPAGSLKKKTGTWPTAPNKSVKPAAEAPKQTLPPAPAPAKDD